MVHHICEARLGVDAVRDCEPIISKAGVVPCEASGSCELLCVRATYRHCIAVAW